MFGKVNAGAGTDGRYEGKFNANSFKDVYITKLRSYLKGDTKLEILTIKGIGYRFVVG